VIDSAPPPPGVAKEFVAGHPTSQTECVELNVPVIDNDVDEQLITLEYNGIGVIRESVPAVPQHTVNGINVGHAQLRMARRYTWQPPSTNIRVGMSPLLPHPSEHGVAPEDVDGPDWLTGLLSHPAIGAVELIKLIV
jgi:hypothetical protein